MKAVRILSASLLLLSGALHLLHVVLTEFEPTSIITLLFGVAYLLFGLFMFRSGRLIVWFGAIVPVVGMLLAVLGMFMNPTLAGAMFILLDVAIVACCLLILFRKEQKAAVSL